jgi:RecA-family ATPase
MKMEEAKNAISLYTTQELKEAPMDIPSCLLDPLIPMRGIVYLHGKWGSGKTAISFEESYAVATGTPFLGLPTTKGRVAFLEIDIPEVLFRQRFASRIGTLNDDTGIAWCFFPKPFNCLAGNFHQTDEAKRLAEIESRFQPNLVIVDTLRKIYHGDERDGGIASQVYGTFQEFFPNSTIQFNAHNRKAPNEASGNVADENFSGHQAWVNDAQSAIHVEKAEQGRMRLKHTKSQYSDLFPSLTLKLSDDGCYVNSLDIERNEVIQKILAEVPKGMKKAEVDEQIAKALKMEPRTARRYRTGFESLATTVPN